MCEALKEIFEQDLTAWTEQSASDTRMSVNDLVARVSSQHDFWQLLRDRFGSQYIVFEFKNYKAQIKQTQIFTTEKYLYRTALRSVAIIISRRGADKNAIKAAKGALREHGKLIINLNEEHIFQMLALRKTRDDPNTVMAQILDEFLIKIER